MKNLYIILLFLLPNLVIGQGWEKTYGDSLWGDQGHSVQQTTDGGYIITGTNKSFGNGQFDVWLIKTDSQGDTLWTKTFGDSKNQRGHSVQQTTDGGYIITGEFEYNPSWGIWDYDVYLIKTDSQGDTLWTKTFGGSGSERGYSVQQTTDGGYIIAGVVADFGIMNTYLIKTDSQGNSSWVKTYSNNESQGWSVQQTIDGGYIITGDFIVGTSSSVWLMKTDSQGNTLWTKTFGNGSGYSVQQTTDGGYILTGSTTSFGNGEKDVYLIKTDSQGNTLWTKTFGGIDKDAGNSVKQTTDGGYIITGIYEDNNGSNEDVYLIKIDSQGNISWTNELDISSTINIHPNPTNDLITIDIENYNGSFNVEIYDLQGRLLETTKSKTISLKKYSKGIYIFRVSYGDKTEEVRVLRD